VAGFGRVRHSGYFREISGGLIEAKQGLYADR
jgi:hypothetical protein